MTDQTTQAVAPDTNAQPPAGAADAGARDDGNDLATFFREYDEKVQPELKPAPETSTVTKTDPRDARISALESVVGRYQASQERSEFESAVQLLKGEHDVEDFEVEGWLLRQARENPKINHVWDNRHNDPSANSKMLSGLKKQYDAIKSQKAKSAVDPDATVDRAAVTAAVRGASSNKAPEDKAPDFGKMTDQEFAAYRRKIGV